MKIAIDNLEPYYTNIALEKIKKYHKQRGDEVKKYHPLWRDEYDKVYCSSIFTWSNKSQVPPGAITGGSGFDLTTTLPPAIEAMRPKINIGFTTRGCIRNCPPCIVRKKEGPFKITGDIYDFWDRKATKLTVLDNNILADKDHAIGIFKQLYENKIQIDFNQGLDCRLLDKDIVLWLKKIRHQFYRFAFDDIGLERQVIKSVKLLKKHGINHSSWYVLIGYNTTFKDDLYRCKLLKKLGQRIYVMRYNNRKDNQMLIALSRWGNSRGLFVGLSFKEFLSYEGNRHYLKNIYKKGVIRMGDKPTPEMKERARKTKKSLIVNLQRLDIYSKFKVMAEIQGVTVVSALKEAVQDYMKKYAE